MAQTFIENKLINKCFNWDTWVDDFIQSIYDYFGSTSYFDDVSRWMIDVRSENLTSAIEVLYHENWDMQEFNPFELDIRNNAGHCLLTLQIAVWGLYHATHATEFKAPMGFPDRVFRAWSADRIAWIAMLGRDSDTYCATAGPMMVAAGLKFSKEMKKNVKV